MPAHESRDRSMRERCPRCHQYTSPKLGADEQFWMIVDFKCNHCNFGWTNFYSEEEGTIIG